MRTIQQSSAPNFFFCFNLILLFTSLSFPQSVRDEIKKIGGSPAYTGSWTPANLPIDTTSTSVYFYGEAPKTKVAKDSGGVSVRPYMRVWYGRDSLYMVDFDGTNKYLAIPSPSGLGLGRGDFTLQFWGEVNYLGGGRAVLGNKGTSGGSATDEGWNWEWAYGTPEYPNFGYISLNLRDSTVSDKYLEFGSINNTQNLSSVHHYCIVFDSSASAAYLYIDGVLRKTDSSIPSLARPIEVNDTFYIGKASGGTYNIGRLGELQILVGKALTESEVKAEFRTVSQFTNRPEVRLWLNFEDIDSLGLDLSSRNNDAYNFNIQSDDVLFYHLSPLIDSTAGYVYNLSRPSDTTTYYYSQSVSWVQKGKDTIWIAAETDTVTVYPYIPPPHTYLVNQDGGKILIKGGTYAIKFKD